MITCYDGGICRNEELIEKLTEQRDTLLEVLKSTREYLQIMVTEGILEYVDLSDIDAAIALAGER